MHEFDSRRGERELMVGSHDGGGHAGNVISWLIVDVDGKKAECAALLVGSGYSRKPVSLRAPHMRYGGVDRSARVLINVACNGKRVVGKREENASHDKALRIVMPVIDCHAHSRRARLEIEVVDGCAKAFASELVASEIFAYVLYRVQLHESSITEERRPPMYKPHAANTTRLALALALAQQLRIARLKLIGKKTRHFRSTARIRVNPIGICKAPAICLEIAKLAHLGLCLQLLHN